MGCWPKIPAVWGCVGCWPKMPAVCCWAGCCPNRPIPCCCCWGCCPNMGAVCWGCPKAVGCWGKMPGAEVLLGGVCPKSPLAMGWEGCWPKALGVCPKSPWGLAMRGLAWGCWPNMPAPWVGCMKDWFWLNML